MHTSILDDLGLVASLKDLCSQFSEQYPDIVVDFEDSGVPGFNARMKWHPVSIGSQRKVYRMQPSTPAPKMFRSVSVLGRERSC